jgi:hypothetical protein
MKNITPIYRNRLAIEILICCCEKYSTCHIFILSRAPRWNLGVFVFVNMAFLILPALSCSHLGISQFPGLIQHYSARISHGYVLCSMSKVCG